MSLKIGYMVDVQNDFMLPNGALYVKRKGDLYDLGVHAQLNTLNKILYWMTTNCQIIIYSGDWHGYDDSEIDTINPNFTKTFPPHCMGDSDSPDGAFIVEDLLPAKMISLSIGPSLDELLSLVKQAIVTGSSLFIHKKDFDIWRGRPEFDEILSFIMTSFEEDSIEFYTAGVVTEICVNSFILGALERNHKVVVFEDGIHEIDSEKAKDCINNWKSSGVSLITIEDLV